MSWEILDTKISETKIIIFSLEEHSTVSAGKLEQDVLETSIESPAIDIQSPFVFLECEASKMQLFSAKRGCPTITLNKYRKCSSKTARQESHEWHQNTKWIVFDLIFLGKKILPISTFWYSTQVDSKWYTLGSQHFLHHGATAGPFEGILGLGRPEVKARFWGRKMGGGFCKPPKMDGENKGSNPMNKWMIWGFSHIFGNTHVLKYVIWDVKRFTLLFLYIWLHIWCICFRVCHILKKWKLAPPKIPFIQDVKDAFV